LKNKDEITLARTSDELVALIRRRAENLFETYQLLCSEAVFFVINQALKGGVSPDTAIRLASAFPDGVGGAGCMCAAFSGALMALGLFVGRRGPDGRGRKEIRAKGRELHDLFRSEFSTICCKILTKKVRDDHRALFKQCTTHTGEAAELAARLILKARPDLLEQADWDFLSVQNGLLPKSLFAWSKTFFDKSKARSRRFENSPFGLKQFKSLIFRFAKIY
jgi:C_GCAxxG_C_C family probable redox protein